MPDVGRLDGRNMPAGASALSPGPGARLRWSRSPAPPSRQGAVLDNGAASVTGVTNRGEPAAGHAVQPFPETVRPLLLVHDYLTQRGGAERVFLSLLRGYPDAAAFTSVYESSQTYEEFGRFRIATSWLDRVGPLRRRPRLGVLFLPLVFALRARAPGDVVCSSSGFAHFVRATGRKIIYCHNPPRWLWQPHDYFSRWPVVLRRLVSATLRPMRWLDARAARSAAIYIANSSSVAERIEAAYGFKPRIVFPPRTLDVVGDRAPVDVPEDFYLTIGRDRGYKNVRIIADAFAGMPEQSLVIVGSPSDYDGDAANVTVLEDISDANLRWLYTNATALIAIAHEDFGLTPIEGFAFGLPCIALRAGGYLDSCREDVTGPFVDEPSVDAVQHVVRHFSRAEYSADRIREHGESFTEETFLAGLQRELDGGGRE